MISSKHQKLKLTLRINKIFKILDHTWVAPLLSPRLIPLIRDAGHQFARIFFTILRYTTSRFSQARQNYSPQHPVMVNNQVSNQRQESPRHPESIVLSYKLGQGCIIFQCIQNPDQSNLCQQILINFNLIQRYVSSKNVSYLNST